jgi:hypothetical protein
VDAIEFDTCVGLTDAGRLVGHVALGERIVCRAVEGLSGAVPADLALRLSHALLTHHASAGSGEPRSLEAVLLRAADGLDAAAATFVGCTAGAALLEERWTDSANPLGRELIVPAAHATCEPDTAVSRCA